MQNAPRKIPERKCCSCGQKKPKAELVRVVRTPEGEIKLDKTGRLNGRGAYLCRDLTCLRRARKGDRLGYSLGAKVEDAVYDRLAAELESLCP